MTGDALRRGLVPAAVFLACAFLLMPQALLGRRTYAAVDLMETTAPYRDALRRRPHVVSPVQTDQAESLATGLSFFRALRHGTFQLWDPAVAAGQPVGTLPLGSFMSPLSVGFLFLPAWYAIGLKAFLALLVSQAFTYLLVRRLGTAVGPAVLAGVAYTLSGTNLVFIHRIDVVFLLPAMFWAVHRLVGGEPRSSTVGGEPRSSTVGGPDLRRMAVLAAFVAWGWFEGFPSGWVYAVYATAAWAAWLAAWGAPGARAAVRRALASAAAMVWGVALAAVTLVPFVDEVVRRGTLDARAGGYGSHIPSIQLFGLFDLSAIGHPLAGPWWSGLNPVESISGVGMIAALAAGAGLVAVALGRPRLASEGARAWPFFCGMAVVAFVVDYLGTPLLTVVRHLPGVAQNPIGRSRFVISLAVAVIGALSLDAWWARRGEAGARASRAASVVVLGVVGAAALLRADPFVRAASAASRLREVAVGFSTAFVMAGAAAAIAALAVRRPSERLRMAATVALAGLLFLQLGWPLRHFTPEAPVGDFYAEQAGHRALGALLGGRYRFAATGFTFYPNSGQALGLPDLRGVALRSRQLRAVIQAVNPQAFARDPLKIDLTREEWNLTSPLLDDLAVRYFAEGTDEMPFGRVDAGADTAWDGWAPADGLSPDATAGLAPGPLNGVSLPLRTSGRCGAALVRLSLVDGDRTVASSARPARDATGGWTGFAVVGRDLVAGQAYRLAVTSTLPGCHVEVGMVGSRVARQLLIEDPGQAVRLASTDQAWIYERPAAWALVSAHRRWRAFPDQARLLAWAAHRPPEDADVAAYVGAERPGSASPGSAPGPADESTVVSSRVAGNGAHAVVRGAAESLLVVSQDLASGWTARIDGRPAPLVAVDGALQGVFVAAGRHTVALSYLPRTFVAGSALSGVALLACGACMAFPGRRRRDG
ncbi:MAG: YfhO family protein [Actinomycetota bacterium]|nr:YfhO family protein [Actinomycetota bacterium]